MQDNHFSPDNNRAGFTQDVPPEAGFTPGQPPVGGNMPPMMPFYPTVEQQIKTTFSKVGLGLVLFMLVPQFIAGIGSAIVMFAAPEVYNSGWFMWVASYVPLYFVGFPLLLWIFKGIPDGRGITKNLPEKQKVTVWQMLLLLMASLTITFALNMLSTALAEGFAMLKGNDVENPLAQMLDNSNWIINFLMLVVVAPVMEEIVFRGLLYNKLSPFGGKVYVLFSGFVFALFHANLFQLFYAFVLGVVLATLYYYTRNLAYPIILHMLINFFGSGFSVILQEFGGMEALEVWGSIVLGLCVVGAVVIVVWLAKYRKSIQFLPADVPIQKKGIVLGNGGMIAYTIVMCALMLLALLTV